VFGLFLLACVLMPLRGEVLDRIAIIVGRQVITELQIDEELRVTAFLNDRPVARDLDARRIAAGHLIEQLLVKREMELSRYPLPEAAEVDRYVDQVRTALARTTNFDEALRSYGLTAETLREHLLVQLTTLQFIDFRFQPDVGISSADIQNYYQRQLAGWKAQHPGARAPTLTESTESIRKTLVEQRTDEALDAWLQESRKQVSIVYLDKSLE
jgi:hypothetical protein